VRQRPRHRQAVCVPVRARIPEALGLGCWYAWAGVAAEADGRGGSSLLSQAAGGGGAVLGCPCVRLSRAARKVPWCLLQCWPEHQREVALPEYAWAAEMCMRAWCRALTPRGAALLATGRVCFNTMFSDVAMLQRLRQGMRGMR
jgi:hypothetical protein